MTKPLINPSWLQKSGSFIALLLMSTVIFNLDLDRQERRTVVPLHFVQGLNGEGILSNVDRLLETSGDRSSTSEQGVTPAWEGQSRVFDLSKSAAFVLSDQDVPKQLTNINPKLGQLWNNTAMLFGANPDGIGVGTAFAFRQNDDSSAVFVTNYHVIQPFCQIPADQVTGQAKRDDLSFRCQSLYVLHDISIDTLSSQAGIDGSHPWKSEVRSILFYDQKLDLAVFEVSVPPGAPMIFTEMAVNYDLKKPVFEQKEARLLPRKNPPTSVQTVFPIVDFEAYLIFYSVPDAKEKSEGSLVIKKGWKQGTIDGIRIFETEKRLGLVSGIKHSMVMQPGSSGGPLAFSDGRIFGINTDLEMNQFYGNSGCSRKLETYVSYYAVPTVYLKGVSHE